MNKQAITYTKKEIPTLAKRLKELLQKYPVMTFSGSLGTGKTTLIQELLRQCGIQERVTSPTFAYFNRYTNKEGHTFYHFDLYRLNSINDFSGAGFEEYLYVPQGSTLIEWPEHIMPLLRERVCHVSLDYDKDAQKRHMVIECRNND